eukprot:6081585-Alexandrium_andersonii.AAC.1
MCIRDSPSTCAQQALAGTASDSRLGLATAALRNSRSAARATPGAHSLRAFAQDAPEEWPLATLLQRLGTDHPL